MTYDTQAAREALLPCPICGGAAFGAPTLAEVQCATRDCAILSGDTFDDAASRWNNRSIPAAAALLREAGWRVDEPGLGGWIKTSDRLPEKPGKRAYEYVECLIFYKGEILKRPWNCEHLCWDDEDQDDFFCNPKEPTHWLPLPEFPTCNGTGARSKGVEEPTCDDCNGEGWTPSADGSGAICPTCDGTRMRPTGETP